jgi:hypothetical protein
MFRRLLPAVCLAFAAAAGGAAELERGLPLIRNFPPDAYDGANQVWSSVALPDGTVLFGNQNQVVEFDGLTWRSIRIPGAAQIRGLDRDAQGVVWAAGVNELGRIDAGPDGQRVFTSLRALVPKEAGDLGTIWQVHATPEGVWFQANGATLRWRDGKFDYWATGERFIVLSFWLGDHLVVATTKGWFKPVAGGKWETLGRPEDKLGDYLPHFAVPHPAGGWLMGLEGPKGEIVGLARWDGAKLTFEPHPLDEFFKAKRLYSAIQLPDGRYCFMTLQGGAVITDARLQQETFIGEKSGLESEAVISAVADAHGALWVGTEWGVSRVDVHPAYSWFGPLNGLSRRTTLTVFRSHWQERLLVPGAQGLMRLEPPDTTPGNPAFRRWSEVDDKVWCMLPDGDHLLVGGLGGIYCLAADGTRTSIRSGSNIFGLLIARRDPDRLYAASLNGLVVLQRTNGVWARIDTVSKVRGNTIAETDDGALWLGTDNQGVWRVRVTPKPDGKVDAEATLFGPEAGLPAGGNKSEVVMLGGAPLFLTSAGPMRFNAATGRFDADPGFGRQFVDGTYAIHAIAADNHGGHWVVANGPGDNLAHKVSQVGYVRDGKFEVLPVPEPDRIGGHKELYLDTTNGREVLWILGQSALLRVDLAVLQGNRPPSIGATLLRGITVSGNRRLPPGGSAGVRLKAEENNLRFAFATPGLAAETAAIHESRLHGFMGGAEERRTEPERTFTNLPPGAYTFAVRGQSADGRWSEPAEFSFVVLAPWWQTPGAWAAYVAGSGLLLFSYIRWRIRRLTRERSRLEAVVAERTAELAHSNAELHRLHRLDQDEKLTVRLSEEKARLELLRYQLNPHFLYNSLNSIRALIYSNASAAGEMVTRLSEFCRWTLTRSAAEMTTVAEEAEMLQAYLDIERTRWQDGLVAKVEIEESARGAPLPQFLLLPLLENAIKYGGKTSPDVLVVRISVWREAGLLVCEVANTGHWVELNGETPRESTRIGLENLRERLRRHYGPDCDFERITEGGWVRVRLRLPQGKAKAGETAI